jgi:ABC-type transport system substrate-binding protein
MFGNRSRRIRSRIARNNRFGTATSAIWNTTYRECATTLAPILMSFSRSVVSDQCFTAGGRASRRRKLPRLYARANSWSRTWLPLTLWFRAIWQVTSQKNGASALGLQRVLGLGSYTTAWAWMHKLRRAMVRPGRDRLTGVVEVDETYWGAEEEGVVGRLTQSKALVIVAAQEEGKHIGRIRMRTIPDLTKATLHQFIRDSVEPSSMVRTDGLPAYRGLEGYAHQPIVGVEPTATSLEASPRPTQSLPSMENLLGFQDYVHKLKEALDAQREVRAAAAGLLYNQEQDELLNPVVLDYNKVAEGFPFIGEVDKYAFEVVLFHPYPQILYWMVFQFFSPLPPEAMEFYNQPGLLKRGIVFDFNPVGTGPYVLESYDPTNQAVLVRNPNFRKELYPSLSPPAPDAAPETVENYECMKNDGMLDDSGKKLPFIDRIVFRIEKEAIPRWNKFMQGYYELSGIQADSFDQAVSLSSRGDLSITDEMRERGIDMIMVDSAYLGFYVFNMTDPVLGGLDEKKRKLRQAISIAIDAGEKLEIFNNGLGTQAQHAIPPGILGHEATEAGMNRYVFRWDKQRNAPVRRSIEDAKKLLAEAGYPDGYGPDGRPLEIKYLMTSPTPGQRSELKLLKKQLGRINVRLETEDCDTTRFYDKVRKGSFQFVRFGWMADYPDPETFLILFYMPEAVTPDMQNQSRYDNPRFNELYRQMSRMENTSDCSPPAPAASGSTDRTSWPSTKDRCCTSAEAHRSSSRTPTRRLTRECSCRTSSRKA